MGKSGILMHISSLPGPYGIGTLGKEAYEFVDFLKAAGQHYWQILPLSPTGYGDSPYQSCSSYAGNPYLIDLGVLEEENLLLQSETQSICWGVDPERVDFGLLYCRRRGLLQRAFARFLPNSEYEAFVEENQSWLEEFALFMAIKGQQQGASWDKWPTPLRCRREDALEMARKTLAREIAFEKFLQYCFFRQWKKLHEYAREKGVAIIGDLPIYVTLDSADVWSHPEVFWLNRLKAAGALYDVIRIDHFRGFTSYWAIDAAEKTAQKGQWIPGPGMDFLGKVKEALPNLQCIAEDLGFITEEVRKLQEASGFPGMKIIQFAYDRRETGDYLPEHYPVCSVCYTGTHDNPTLAHWLQEADPEDVAEALAHFPEKEGEGPVWAMIRGAMGTASRLCIVQMQDYLQLGEESRMNQPGLLSGKNWTWRAKPGFATENLAAKIRGLTELYGRK